MMIQSETWYLLLMQAVTFRALRGWLTRKVRRLF